MKQQAAIPIIKVFVPFKILRFHFIFIIQNNYFIAANITGYPINFKGLSDHFSDHSFLQSRLWNFIKKKSNTGLNKKLIHLFNPNYALEKA
jgi:hypothetical protein